MSEQQPNIEEAHAQADEFGQLTGHNYDGIQEYDNPTPSWWIWVFIASVLFAGAYLFLMLVAAGDLSPNAEYERAAVANLKKKFGEIGILEADAPTIVQYMNEPQWLQLGEGVYKANCVTCHGLNGEGNSGPNLTDEAYINITKIEDIGTILKEGAKAGAMPAWANRLHPNELVLVASYVASLRGTNASGGKAAEGQAIDPWPTDVAVQTPQAAPEPEAAQ